MANPYVAKDSARKTGATRKARAARRRGNNDHSVGREIAIIVLSLVGIILGLAFVAGSVAFWYGSQVILGILDEVGEKDFTNQYQRISKYEMFFDNLTAAGYDVIREEPKIDTKPESSAKFYLWRVQPAGSSEFCIYRWRYDLQSDDVQPSTNAALLLDIELGYIKTSDARDYSFYDPDDELACAIALDNLGLMQLQNLGTVWQSDLLPEGPVMSPLVSVEEASSREARFMAQQAPAVPEGEETAGSQEAVEIGGEAGGAPGGEGGDGAGQGSEPPAEGAGEGGEGAGGGGEDPGGGATEVGAGGDAEDEATG